MKVIFLGTNPPVFRATSIGYLYEIAQKNEVWLLTEKLDDYTMSLLEDKTHFPGLDKIILFEQPCGGNILFKWIRTVRTLKKTMKEFRPNIAIAPSDIWPVEMIFMRYAKRYGIPNRI